MIIVNNLKFKDGNVFKFVDNDDENIIFPEWYGLYVNGTLNLIAPIDVSEVLFALSNLENGKEIKEHIEKNTWSHNLSGFKNI